VFFLDPEQSFRVRENTTIEDISAWALELGASVERVSLHGVQFRCAGSAEYVAWVESLLGGGSAALNRVYASVWHRGKSISRGKPIANHSGNVIAFPACKEGFAQAGHVAAEGTHGYVVPRLGASEAGMDFRVFRDPFEMESELRRIADGCSVRLVSTYSRPWKTESSTFPHRLPSEALDFNEVVESQDGKQRTWSRPWNFVPGQDYTGFVAGRPGLPIHDDPLCEVGCTYAVRGFDFDYLGLLWLDDLLWRDGKWIAHLKNVHEGPVAPAGPKGANVIEKLRQAYRILLTRAIRGMFVWIPDNETREHVMRSLATD
jgi:DUF2075 family protein